MEDNQAVALAMADLLAELGYRVEHVSSGTDALKRLQERSYALVFSDLLMPDSIGGLELARIVRDYHSDVPILLATGFSDKAQQAVREGFKIIQKPFDLRALAAAIDQLQAAHVPAAEAVKARH